MTAEGERKIDKIMSRPLFIQDFLTEGLKQILFCGYEGLFALNN